jgi:hypothetical protein
VQIAYLGAYSPYAVHGFCSRLVSVPLAAEAVAAKDATMKIEAKRGKDFFIELNSCEIIFDRAERLRSVT